MNRLSIYCSRTIDQEPMGNSVDRLQLFAYSFSVSLSTSFSHVTKRMSSNRTRERFSVFFLSSLLLFWYAPGSRSSIICGLMNFKRSEKKKTNKYYYFFSPLFFETLISYAHNGWCWFVFFFSYYRIQLFLDAWFGSRSHSILVMNCVDSVSIVAHTFWLCYWTETDTPKEATENQV